MTLGIRAFKHWFKKMYAPGSVLNDLDEHALVIYERAERYVLITRVAPEVHVLYKALEEYRDYEDGSKSVRPNMIATDAILEYEKIRFRNLTKLNTDLKRDEREASIQRI